MTSVSVLICTYNRPTMLDRCLRALIADTVEKPDEVVIVNGGDDNADEVVSAYTRSQYPAVQLVKTKNVNLATSRNVGLPHCSGDLIAMTDDDAQVFGDWITQIKAIHAQFPDAGVAGGLVLGTNPKSLPGRIADATLFPSWSSPRYVRTVPGVNVSYKQEVIRRVGLQDVRLFRGEDVDFNWRCARLGYRVLFHPGMRVYHHHRATIRGLLNQQYMYGRAYVLVRTKWPDMYCVYPHGLHGMRDLLRSMNFAAATLYQPPLTAQRLPVRDRVAALPLLWGLETVWRLGMLAEMRSPWAGMPGNVE